MCQNVCHIPFKEDRVIEQILIATHHQIFRLTITIPILDHLNSQLEERFDGSSVSSKLLTEFIKLLPSEIFKNKSQVERCDIASIIDCYTDDLPSEYAIDVELQVMKWRDNAESPKHNTAPKALAKADKIVFPNLQLLHVAVTSPVTSVVCERSISFLNHHCGLP